MEKRDKGDLSHLPDISGVASACECTGLIPAAPADWEEKAAYLGLFSTAIPNGGEVAQNPPERGDSGVPKKPRP